VRYQAALRPANVFRAGVTLTPGIRQINLLRRH